MDFQSLATQESEPQDDADQDSPPPLSQDDADQDLPPFWSRLRPFSRTLRSRWKVHKTPSRTNPTCLQQLPQVENMHWSDMRAPLTLQ